MIYIFSAFYAEAKNIIDHYGLKKEKSPEMSDLMCLQMRVSGL